MADTIGNLELGIGVKADVKSAENTAGELKNSLVATCTSINKSLADTPNVFSQLNGEIQRVVKSVSDMGKVSDNVEKLKQSAQVSTFGESTTRTWTEAGGFTGTNLVQVTGEESNKLTKLISDFNLAMLKADALQDKLDEIRETESPDFAKTTNQLQNQMVVVEQLHDRFEELRAQEFPQDYARLSGAGLAPDPKQVEVQWGKLVSTVSSACGTIGNKLLSVAKQTVALAKTAFGKLASVFNLLGKSTKSSGASALSAGTSFKKLFLTILKYGFGIRSLYFLFRKLRTAMTEAFKSIAQNDTDVNRAISNIKSSMTQLRNQVALAFTPALIALEPIFLKLIALANSAARAIASVVAVLTGNNMIKIATYQYKDYADSVKNANKQLAKFDELNNLTSGSASGKDAVKFEEAPVNPKIKKILSDLFDPIKSAWDKCKDYVTSSFKGMVKSLKVLVGTIWDGFIRAWKEKAEGIFIHIFGILGDIFVIIGNIADRLNDALRINDNWYHICLAVLDIFETIVQYVHMATTYTKAWSANLDFTPLVNSIRVWLESLKEPVETLMGILFDFYTRVLLPIADWVIGDGLPKLFNIFTNFNNKVKWDKIRKGFQRIWNALKPFAEKVGEGLLIFIESLSDRLANWANDGGFDNWIDKITEFLDNFDAKKFAKDLEKLFNALLNVAKAIKDIAIKIAQHKDTIINLISFVTKHLKGIVTTGIILKVVGMLGSFATGLVNLAKVIESTKILSLFGKLGDALGSILSVKPGSVSIVEHLGNAIIDAGGVIPAIDGAFTSAVTSGSFATAGAAIAGALVASIGAAILGFEVGKKLGEWLFPNDSDIYENFKWFDGEDSFFNTVFGTSLDVLADAWNMMWSDMGLTVSNTFTDMGLSVSTFMYNMQNGTNLSVDEYKKKMNEIAVENQKYADATKDNMFRYMVEDIQSGALPSMKELRDVTKGNDDAFNQLVDMIYEVNPQMRELADAMAENNVAGSEYLDTVSGIYIGLQRYNENGGDLKDTLEYLKATTVGVSTNTKEFLKQLDKGKEKYVQTAECITGVSDAYGNLGDTSDETATKVSENTKKMGSGFGRLINGIIDMINGLLSKLSGIKVPEWMKDRFGIGDFNIPQIPRIEVPQLARGAVIPPNKKFLAMLGDQRHGTNIETPLSTMVDAFNQASKGSSEEELALLRQQNELLQAILEKDMGITNGAIFKSVQNSARVYKNRTGVSAFV